MKLSEITLLHYLRWTARITGTAIAAFLVVMLAGHLLDKEDLRAILQLNGKSLFVFILFPMTMVTGYALAWKKEIAGSLIVLIGQALLFILRSDLLLSGLAWLSAPALLFMVLVWRSRSIKNPRS